MPRLMGLDATPRGTASIATLNIVIQGGAILAVAGLYWRRVACMIRGVLGRDTAGLRLAINLLIAFLPAAIVGLALRHWIKAHLFSTGPVLVSLLLGGVYMILVDHWRSGRFGLPTHSSRLKEVTEMTPAQALTIGLLQCVAMWPGTSRSMTITGGLFAGLRPTPPVQFSGACRRCWRRRRDLKNRGLARSEASSSGATILLGMESRRCRRPGVRWLVGSQSPRARRSGLGLRLLACWRSRGLCDAPGRNPRATLTPPAQGPMPAGVARGLRTLIK